MATVCVVSGVALGLGCTFYANAIRKTYMMRAPWRHMGAMIGGGLLGYGYHRVNESETRKQAVLKQKYRELYGVNMENPALVQAPFRSSSAEGKEETSGV